MAFRKYPSIERPTRKVQMLPSQGITPMYVIPQRRLGMPRHRFHARQLGSLGVASAGASVGTLIWWTTYGQAANV